MPFGLWQSRRQLFNIAKIIGAFWINAFMNSEMFSILFGLKCMIAVRAGKKQRSCRFFAADKGLIANLTLKFTFAAIVVINVMMCSVTTGAYGAFR